MELSLKRDLPLRSIGFEMQACRGDFLSQSRNPSGQIVRARLIVGASITKRRKAVLRITL